MIALCIIVGCIVGTIVACALMRGSHLNEAPGWPEPILRAQPKERERA